jgi:hypothetical protein
LDDASELNQIKDEPAQSQRLKKLGGPASERWLAETTDDRFRDENIPDWFHEAAAVTICREVCRQQRSWGGRVKKEERASMAPGSAPHSDRGYSLAPSSTVPTTDTTNKRMQVGGQTAMFSEATVDIYEYQSDTIITTMTVLKLLPSAIFDNYIGGNTTTPIIPERLAFENLVNRFSNPRFRKPYRPGESRIFDVLKGTEVADDDDLASATPHQFFTQIVI